MRVAGDGGGEDGGEELYREGRGRGQRNEKCDE
jgi:hypothetical protein